jgi:hypothetical protein
LCLAAIHFIPEAGWIPPILLSLTLALVNAGIGYCLGNGVDARRVTYARALATAV